MLRSAEEIALLASALEPGIRDPRRPEYGIENIFADFLNGTPLSGRRILELGPGHYEFCDAVARRGGVAEAVELDPPVAELGRRRGFVVHPGNLKDLPLLPLTAPYDGLFSKGSTNPFWFHRDEAALRRYTETLVQLVKPDGWHWIVSCPWTNPPVTDREMLEWLAVEERLFRGHGFESWDIPSRIVAAFYGISYVRPRLTLFWRGLRPARLTTTTPVRIGGYLLNAVRRRVSRLLA